MSIRWRKVARDLWGNRSRTLLVVVAIAIGLIGLSATLRARAIFTANLNEALDAANPSSAVVRTEGAGDATVAAVAARGDVAEAEGRLVVYVRMSVGDELRSLRLLVLEDPAGAAVDRLRPEEGTWPPPAGTIALERSSLDLAGIGIGESAELIDPTGRVHLLRVSATTHDLTVVSGKLVEQVVFGYTSRQTWEGLGLPGGWNEIAFTVTGDRRDADHIGTVADAVAADVAARGSPVLAVTIPPPGRHVLDNVISSLLLILGALAVLSLVLSGFLVFNTVAATLARQRPQVGIMKAIGASRREVLTLYLTMVGAYAVLAVALALPIGALAARAVTTQLGTLLNIDIVGFGVPAWVWVVEFACGLLMPVAAALGPMLSGTGATVAEVMRGPDTSADFGTGRIDRVLIRLQGLPGSLRYAARNTFRRKLRLTLTVVALSLAGAILVTVLTLRSSLLATVDSVAAYWQQDVTVDLQHPEPLQALRDIVAPIPEIDAVEGWLIATGTFLEADGRQAPEETIVFGVPPDSRFIEPTLLEGRWLESGDGSTAVINVDASANEPDIAVGDEVTLRILGTGMRVRVVGISTTQLVGSGAPRPATPMVYVPYGHLTGSLGMPGAATRLAVSGADGDPAAQAALAAAVDGRLASGGVAVQAVDTGARMREQVERLSRPLLMLLVAMAALFAVVGGLGLLGTMTLNVLERTNEFGIVRAVGAQERTVLSIVLVEGLTVAALSWLIGSLLALPIGWAMGRAVGIAFIKVPLAFAFAPLGVAAWLAMAVVLAAIASWLPARRASAISVRDAIAYE